MKLNKSQLKQIIQEEVELILEAVSLSTRSFEPEEYISTRSPDPEPYSAIDYSKIDFKDLPTDTAVTGASSPVPAASPAEKVTTVEAEDEQFAEEDAKDLADDHDHDEDEQFAEEDTEDINLEDIPHVAHGIAPDPPAIAKPKKSTWVQVASSDKVIVRNSKRAYSTQAMADYIDELSNVSGGNWYVGDLSK